MGHAATSGAPMQTTRPLLLCSLPSPYRLVNTRGHFTGTACRRLKLVHNVHPCVCLASTRWYSAPSWVSTRWYSAPSWVSTTVNIDRGRLAMVGEARENTHAWYHATRASPEDR